jgi:superfamily II DNA/RNA helicase
LNGQDVYVQAPSGKGKTGAYVVPLLETLQRLHSQGKLPAGIHGLIVVPTALLAQQVYVETKKLGQHMKHLQVELCSGAAL